MKKTLQPSLRFVIALFTIICGYTSSFGQSTEQCLSSILHQRLMATDATYAQTMIDNENILQAAIADIESGRAMPTSYRIPVVVHIIHLGEAVGVGTNISDAQVYSAIRTLNEAYRKKAGTEFSGAGVDTGLEFCLAQKDAAGNPSTGIIRVNGSGTSDYATNGITTSGTTNEATIKNLSKWNNTKYYNIWVVSEIDGNNGGAGVQGFAYFPGTSATYDGAVMMYNCFGYDPTGVYGYNLKSYTNRNKTLIHEMGHALNLYHTFEGDGTGATCPTNTNCNTQGDRCCDIPPHMRSNSTCVADNTVNTCLTGSTAVDYQHNYMDYSADVCTNMFTTNQSSRMNATLATGGTRASLATAANLTACGCSIPVVLFSASPVNPCLGIPVQFTDESLNFPTSWSWTFTGGTPGTATTQNPTSTYNAAGAYSVSLQATTAAGVSGTLTKTAYINPVGSATLPFSENFESTTFPPTGWTRQSGDAPSVAWGTDGIHQWERRPAAGNTGSTAGSAAMNMFNYNLVGPPVDNLIVKPVSLSGMTAAQMTFKVAYRNYGAAANYDSLKVFVSTDCGNTYGSPVYSKFGTGLATSGSLNTTFTPSAAGDWRTETVNLNAYIGQTIIVKFATYSNYGNNLYLDDVNITGTSGASVASVAITSSDADNVICAGTSVTFTATPTNGGTAPTYQWKVNGTNVGTGGATYTTTTLTTGQVVTCVMTSNLPGVTGSPATSNAITMTVNAVPATPTVTTSSPDCEGQTISLNTPAVTGATYAWTGPSAFTSAVQNPTIASATAAMAGTYSVTVTVNGCTSAAGTAAVVVNPTPATPTAGSNSPVCAGATLNLTSNTVTGATYAWTGPSAYISAVEDPTLPTSTVAMSGTYSLTVTVGGCTSAVATTAVTVNAIPATPTVTTSSPDCTGQTISLNTPAVTGATYAWTGPSSFTSALQNPTRPAATAAMAGTYSVTVTVAGCTSAVGTAAVVVNTTPATPTVTTSSPDCEGQTISLSTPTVTGATYAWSGPASFASTVRTPTIASATVAMSGTYSVTVTTNGCTSAAGTATVVVNPIPATPTASSNSPVCTGTTISLTTPAVTGATYAWTGPSGYSNATQNPNRTGATAAMAGTYSVTVTVSGCTSAAGTTAVAVNSSVTPGVTIAASPSGAICAGASVTFTATPTNGGTTPTYQWKVNGTNVGTGGATYTSSTLTNGQVVTCVMTSGSSCASPATATSTGITMTVNPVPATPAASSNSAVCTGQTISLTTPAAGGATYSWTGPSSYTSALQNPARPAATAAMAGTYSITITVSGCTSAAGTTTVVVNPTPAAPAAGSNTPVCAGAQIDLTSTTVAGATYAWTGPSAYTSALEDPSLTGATAAMAGTYSVTVTVAGCTSPVATTAVTVNPVPSAPAPQINGSSTPAAICEGGTITLTSNTVSGSAYAWSGPAAYTAAVQNPAAITNATPAMSGTYSLTVTVGGCTSVVSTADITVNPSLTPSVNTVAAPSGAICAGTPVSFTASDVNGGTTPAYQWQVNGSNAGTGATFNSTTLANGDVVTCILTSSEACASPATVTSAGITMTVNNMVTPSVATTITMGSNPMCSGQTVSFLATAMNGGSSPSYQWQVNGANAGTMAVYTSSVLNNGDVVTCILTSNAACADPLSDTSAAVTMIVNPVLTPAVSIAATPSGAICEGDSVMFNATATNGGTAPTYQWQVNGSNAGTGAAFTSGTLLNGDAVTCILTSNEVCASPATASSNSISMTVNPIPATPAITQTGTTLTSSAPSGNQWYQDGILIAGATGQTYTYTVNGTYTVIVTAAGCSSEESAPLVVMNVGIAEASDPYLLNVYPNPNEGIFTVSFFSADKESYTVELTNALGQLVFSEEMKDFTGRYAKQLSVEAFGKGVYMISLTNAHHETVKKIVVY